MNEYGIEDKGKDFMYIAGCINQQELSSFQQFCILSMIEYYLDYYNDFNGYSILLTLLEDKINPPQSILNPN